jgi:hypothetical protein
MAAVSQQARAKTYAVWRSDYASLDPESFPNSVELAPLLYPGTADARFAFALDRLLTGLATECFEPSRGGTKHSSEGAF